MILSFDQLGSFLFSGIMLEHLTRQLYGVDQCMNGVPGKASVFCGSSYVCSRISHRLMPVEIICQGIDCCSNVYPAHARLDGLSVLLAQKCGSLP